MNFQAFFGIARTQSDGNVLLTNVTPFHVSYKHFGVYFGLRLIGTDLSRYVLVMHTLKKFQDTSFTPMKGIPTRCSLSKANNSLRCRVAVTQFLHAES